MRTLLARLSLLAGEIERRFAWLPPTAARFTVGWVFFQSGWGKVQNPENAVAYLSSLGIPFPELQAPLVAWTELVCGALLLAGLATRLASLPLVVVMTVALRTALADQIGVWSDALSLAEFGYIVLLTGLIVFGPGPLSLDALALGRLAARGARALST